MRIKKELDFSVIAIKKESTVAKGRKFIVKYEGFNNYPNNVRIDLSLRESVQIKPKNLKVMHNYDTLSTFRLPTMAKEEIIAEKVRAVIYSGASRHLYDLNYLFDKQVLLEPDLVQTKINLYGDKFSSEKLKESILGMEKDWVGDLSHLLSQDQTSLQRYFCQSFKENIRNYDMIFSTLICSATSLTTVTKQQEFIPDVWYTTDTSFTDS